MSHAKPEAVEPSQVCAVLSPAAEEYAPITQEVADDTDTMMKYRYPHSIVASGIRIARPAFPVNVVPVPVSVEELSVTATVPVSATNPLSEVQRVTNSSIREVRLDSRFAVPVWT